MPDSPRTRKVAAAAKGDCIGTLVGIGMRSWHPVLEASDLDTVLGLLAAGGDRRAATVEHLGRDLIAKFNSQEDVDDAPGTEAGLDAEFKKLFKAFVDEESDAKRIKIDLCRTLYSEKKKSKRKRGGTDTDSSDSDSSKSEEPLRSKKLSKRTKEFRNEVAETKALHEMSGLLGPVGESFNARALPARGSRQDTSDALAGARPTLPPLAATKWAYDMTELAPAGSLGGRARVIYKAGCVINHLKFCHSVNLTNVKKSSECASMARPARHGPLYMTDRASGCSVTPGSRCTSVTRSRASSTRRRTRSRTSASATA